jgi:2-polyprenyl-6-methoxyphenol hydroxylase-like FAD-dependent oxidoreductase
LADAETLADVILTRESWRTLGDLGLLQRFARRRAVPNLAMAWATDGLWQLFAQENAAVRELRNRGMSLVNRLPPLRRWLAGRALDI